MIRRNKTRIAMILIMTAGLSTTGNRAAGEEPHVQVTVDRNRIHVGDPIRMTISINAPEDTRIIFPCDSMEFDPFVVLDRTHRVLSNSEESISESLELIVSAYQTGDLEIPAVEIGYETDSGQTGTVFTQPEPIRIDSVLTGQEKAPYDIKEPVSVGASWKYKIGVVTGTAVVLASIAILIAWIRRRRKRFRKEIQESEPSLPPDQVALSALAQLERDDLISRGEIRRFYIQLMEIFKRYIGDRFGFSAVERTTGEIRSDSLRLKIQDRDRRDIIDILELADLVKFARFQPPIHRSKEVFAAVRQFVDRTREQSLTETGVRTGGSVP
ncbi:hypothetical protein JXA40_12325 [bacterium]|nr:hypothetical protein [candidate division CSSED10-310 bacterium]